MIDPGFEILNQRGTPMFFSDVFANRPTAGIVGRIFISTDTFAFYRDNGVTWDLIGGPGTGTITGSGTAFKYPVFTNTTEIGDGTIEQLSTKNQSTKDFEIKTSTDDGIYESELFLTNRFSGVDDTITFQYGRTISGGTPFLKISDNNALFPTSNLQYQGGQFGVYDSLLVVQNTIQNNIADFYAVEPVVRIGATGASNNAQLTFSASAGTYAGIIRLGNSGNVFQIRTFANVVALQVNDNTSVSISNLGGSGNQMVVVDNTGLLSKQAIPIAGSIAANQIAYGSASNTIAGSNQLYWDNSGQILGINTITPNTGGYGGPVLGIYGATNTGGNIWLTSDATSNNFRTGRIGFGTEGNTTNKELIRIVGLTDGSTAGNIGGRLQILTKPDNAASVIQRLVIAQNGAIGVGTNTSPLYAFDVRNTINTVAINAASNTANDILYYASGNVTGSIFAFNAGINATGIISHLIQNNNSASGQAVLELNVTSTSTGDCYTSYVISGANQFTIGIDNSDSDKLKFGNNANPSTGTPIICLHTSGNMSIGSATDPAIKLAVTGEFATTQGATIQGLRIGYGAGSVVTNSIVGSGTLIVNTSGFGNTTMGYFALYLNTTGYYNSAYGMNALFNNTDGFENVAVGYRALYNNLGGDFNVAIGNGAGIANTTGINNIFVGPNAGSGTNANTTGQNNIFIGSGTVGTSATDSNKIFIGNAAHTDNYIFGNFNITDKNIVLSTTTGTKIGTATTQKLSLWNATPIVQPTTAVGSATFASPGAGSTIKTDDTFDGYTLQQVVKALRNIGILA